LEEICPRPIIPAFRRFRKYGDIGLVDAKQIKELEKENAELKKTLVESMLENRAPKEIDLKNKNPPFDRT